MASDSFSSFISYRKRKHNAFWEFAPGSVNEGSSLTSGHALPAIQAAVYLPWSAFRPALTQPESTFCRSFIAVSVPLAVLHSGTCSPFKLCAFLVPGAPPDFTSPLLSCRASQGESCALIPFFSWPIPVSCLSFPSYPLFFFIPFLTFFSFLTSHLFHHCHRHSLFLNLALKADLAP